MPLTFTTKTFSGLTTKELYQILQLRSEVFVVEQDCVYQDVDGKDQKALHLIGTKGDKIIAYARMFDAGDYFEYASVGRVVVKQNERKYGYGHLLMQEAHKVVNKHFKTTIIKISAQAYLEKFYNTHGYQKEGEGYLEDGIPHIAMIVILK